jgi:flagellar motor switch protein FliN
MTWTEFSWHSVEPDGFDDLVGLAAQLDLLRSALDEAASGAILGPAAIVTADLATIDRAELPDGFVPVGSFELLGTARRSIAAALDPSLGTAIGETEVTAAGLAPALLEAVDGALSVIIGEGIGLGPATDLPDGDELLLVRFGLASSAGEPPTVGIALALAAAARTEFATHLVALKALAGAPSPAPTSPAPAIPAPTSPAPAIPAPPAAAPPAPVRAPEPETERAAIRPAQFNELASMPVAPGRHSIELLLGVNLQVTVEIGRARLPIRDVLSLAPGSIVELDKLAGEKVDVLVNGHQIATGEVVVVDENFGVRITEVVSPERRVTTSALA